MLGKLIGDIRAFRGMTLQELCEGLCEERLLRKYESEEIEIEKLMADALMQRLGKSMDKYDILLSKKEYQLAQARTHMQELLRRNKLEQAEKAISDYEKQKMQNPKLHRQFVLLQRAELLRRKNVIAKEQLAVVQEAMNQTIHEDNIHPQILRKKSFSVIELMLFTRYAILLEAIGDRNEASEWYQNIVLHLEQSERDLADKVKLYPLAAYQLAKYYVMQKRYEQGEEYIEKACNFLSQAKMQSALFIRLLELKFELAQNAECVFVSAEERACYDCMKEVMQEQGQEYMQNWYPMYSELHIHSVNQVIYERRKALGWSREELAAGICDSRTIARIEQGQSMPQRETQERLLERLGISAEKYDGGIITGKYSDYHKVAELMEYANHQNYIGAEMIFDDLKKGLDMKYLTNRQFIQYWSLTLCYGRREISNEEYCIELWKLLRVTLALEEQSFRKDIILFEYERRAIKRLAWYEEGKRESFLFSILWEQYKKIELQRAEKFFHDEYYSGIVYCLSEFVRRKGDEKTSAYFARHFLNQIGYLNKDIDWSRILYELFLVKKQVEQQEEQPKSNNETFRWVRYAYAISKIYLKNHQVCNYIKTELVSQYGENDMKKILQGLIIT